jgi:hypothetical protein
VQNARRQRNLGSEEIIEEEDVVGKSPDRNNEQVMCSDFRCRVRRPTYHTLPYIKAKLGALGITVIQKDMSTLTSVLLGALLGAL